MCDTQLERHNFAYFVPSRQIGVKFHTGVVQWVLAAYTFGHAQTRGIWQGLLVVALSVMTFIFKKILLAFTDPIGIDSAMLVSGAYAPVLPCF